MTTACLCSQIQHTKHSCEADTDLLSWILRYDPERLHYHAAVHYLVLGMRSSLQAMEITAICLVICMKRGCLWSSRHYLPQAKSAFTSRVQRVLFIYFIKAFVPLSKYSKSENYETWLVSQMAGYHQQSGCRSFWSPALWEKSLFRKQLPLSK